MTSMTIQELYDKLNSKEFQENDNSLFYNYYIYQYPANKEYEMRAQLDEFKQNLVRPNSFVDVIMLDLFETFCEFIDSQPFGFRYPSKLGYILEKDSKDENADIVTSVLTDTAHQHEFFIFVNEKILRLSQENQHLKHPYVFVYGVVAEEPEAPANIPSKFRARAKRTEAAENSVSIYDVQWVVASTTDIEDIEAAKIGGSQKFLRNGILLIENNGKTYNALGIEIK